MAAAAVNRREVRTWRWLFAAPRFVFEARLGFVFRRRIICVEHEGRASGELHLTPLEVLYRDKTSDEFYVVSARGERSDWYRNIKKYPAEAVYFGSRKRQVRQRFVPVDEATRVVEIYRQRHPKAAAGLLQIAGVTTGPTPEAWISAMQRLPMVAFQPKRNRPPGRSPS